LQLRRRHLLAGSLALPLARCASPPRVAQAELVRGTEPVYVIAEGWHTDICLPAARIPAPLDALRADYPRAEWLEIGWGQRDVYMTPNPSLLEELRATMPGPAVALVRPLLEPTPAGLGDPAAQVVRLLASQDGFARLCDALWASFARDAGGRPRRIGPGQCGDCLFYASDGTYDLAHTCNTWTAEMLSAGGFPVRTQGVIRASEVMQQIT
jgi:uncharacterized protein (TIGR02117 family)